MNSHKILWIPIIKSSTKWAWQLQWTIPGACCADRFARSKWRQRWGAPEKYESQLGWFFPIYGNKKMFQTTNQLLLLLLQLLLLLLPTYVTDNYCYYYHYYFHIVWILPSFYGSLLEYSGYFCYQVSDSHSYYCRTSAITSYCDMIFPLLAFTIAQQLLYLCICVHVFMFSCFIVHACMFLMILSMHISYMYVVISGWMDVWMYG